MKVLIPLSADTASQLAEKMTDYRRLFGNKKGLTDMRALSKTAMQGPHHPVNRIALIGQTPAELLTSIDDRLTGAATPGLISGSSQGQRKLAFLFPGKGGIWQKMGAELYLSNKVFRESVDACDLLFHQHGSSLSIKEIYRQGVQKDQLASDELMMPVLFVFQVSVNAILNAWGIRPDAIIGQSVGEISGACCSGAISLDQAVKLVLEICYWPPGKGRGTMASANVNARQAADLLQKFPDISLAGMVTDASALFSGPTSSIDHMRRQLEAEDIFCKILPVDHAYHSPAIEVKKIDFFREKTWLQPVSPVIPYYSSYTGGLVKEIPMDLDFWFGMMRGQVSFADAFSNLLDECPDLSVIEIHPHPVLSFAVEEIGASKKIQRLSVTPTLKKQNPGIDELLHALGMLYEEGYDIRWDLVMPDMTATVAKTGSRAAHYTRARESLTAGLAKLLGRPGSSIGDDIPLKDLGADSLILVQLQNRLQTDLDIRIPISFFWNYPRLQQLVEAIGERLAGVTDSTMQQQDQQPGNPRSYSPVNDEETIAIVGAGCRLPGGIQTPDQLWEALIGGADLVGAIPETRWHADAFFDADPLSPGRSYSKAGAFLQDIDTFDNQFFSISGAEAASLDPQQRLLLEVSWEAMENAGIAPSSLAGTRTGTYVGIINAEYSQLGFSSTDRQHLGKYEATGNFLSLSSGRLAYFYDFKGPAISVDTACSSSLVALNMACRDLLTGTADSALVGGVNLMITPNNYIVYSKMTALSPTGRCRSFDEKADGFVRGEGCVVVVLKRLSDALRDKNDILAIIRGSAINSDGRSNGLTAPNGASQRQLISDTLTNASIQPHEVGYVEAHGTGTPLGDPIELEAIREAYSAKERSTPLFVGSIKSNLGHLESAAGLAGLLKIILSIRKGAIPANLHFKKLNPYIEKDGKVEIAANPIRLDELPQPFIAGLSAFGFSGTNAHILVQEPPPVIQGQPRGYKKNILTLSAKSPAALQSLAKQYARFIDQHRHLLPEDIGYSANTCKDHFRYRHAFLFRETDEAYRALTNFAATMTSEPATGKIHSFHFLFSGQGSQYKAMGQDLYGKVALFRQIVDYCDAILVRQLDYSIKDVLLKESDLINNTFYTQPALFVLQYALDQVWRSWGIRPSVVLGHSIGEIAAAVAADVMTLDEALRMVASRAAVMNRISANNGSMLAVIAPQQSVEQMLEEMRDGSVEIAAINGAANTVLSGPVSAIEKVQKIATRQQISSFRLQTSHAFHSSMMTPVLEDFRAAIQDIHFQRPTIKYISSVTGDFVTDEVTGADYWCDQIIKPVRFSEAAGRLRQLEKGLDIEIGPRPVLINMITEGKPDPRCLPSMEERQPGFDTMLTSLSRLYKMGADINWQAIYSAEHARNIPLPNYPFQRRHFWIDHSLNHNDMTPAVHARPLSDAGKKEKIGRALADILCKLLQEPEVDTRVSLLELGVDSMILITFLKEIGNRFGVLIELPRLFDTFSTIDALTEHISTEMRFAPDPEPVKPSTSIIAPAPPLSAPATPLAAPGGPYLPDRGNLEDLLTSQVRLMNEQLRIWQQMNFSSATTPSAAIPSTASSPSAAPDEKLYANLTAFRSIKSEPDKLTAKQQKFIGAFAQRYNTRTSQSKTYAQQHRKTLADWIASIDFRLSVKQLQYPIVSASSDGAYITDVDGNRYVDLAMGFGVNYFGNNAPFIRSAIRRQMEEGYELATQSDLAGETAEFIARVTGTERVAFCNTGTESIMVALRIARAATRRKKVVLFTGSYHGGFDGVLGQSNIIDGQNLTTPTSLGTLPGMVQDLIVLTYGSAETLDVIRRQAQDIAAVLVEPVQSRRPGFQPHEFLRELRLLTENKGIALIFDEIITGFRICPGGAQEFFGIQADILTYGKIIGGGLPIGVVAGKKRYMDMIDGGWWDYNEDSFPPSPMAFFAGTFCRHPLSMAACHAVIGEILKEGRGLQDSVNSRTTTLADAVNSLLKQKGVPLQIMNFGSLFRFESSGNYNLLFNPIEMQLFFYMLMEKGIYTWERRICFLSTRHTDQETGLIRQAVGEVIDEMLANDFFNLIA